MRIQWSTDKLKRLLPFSIRAKGLTAEMVTIYGSLIVLAFVNPIALENIGWVSEIVNITQWENDSDYGQRNIIWYLSSSLLLSASRRGFCSPRQEVRNNLQSIAPRSRLTDQQDTHLRRLLIFSTDLVIITLSFQSRRIKPRRLTKEPTRRESSSMSTMRKRRLKQVASQEEHSLTHLEKAISWSRWAGHTDVVIRWMRTSSRWSSFHFLVTNFC